MFLKKKLDGAFLDIGSWTSDNGQWIPIIIGRIWLFGIGS